jgi:hypothetical protein
MVAGFHKRSALWLAACIYAALAHCSGWANPTVDQLAQGFLGREILAREQVLRDLKMEFQKAPKEFALPEKAALFKGLDGMDSLNFVFRAAHFLATLPEDPEILKLARAALDKNDAPVAAVVSALCYLERHDPARFKQYFGKAGYKGVSGPIRSLFSESAAVSGLRQEYLRDLLAQFVTWTPDRSRGERRNPFDAEVRGYGIELLPAILERFPLGENQPLPLALIYLLGEISSPRAFHVVLSEYMARPNMRSAITLGSSLGPEQVEALFDNFREHEKELRELLAELFKARWVSVRNYSLADLKQALLNDLPGIVEDCRRRSKPITG